MKSNLYFFFPYMEESGVPMLFLRVSRWVAEHYGDTYDCFVVDYPNGAMARNLTCSDKVKVFSYSNDRVCEIGDNSIVIFQSNNIGSIYRNLNLSPNTKVFWWTLHVRCLAPVLLPMPIGELTFKYHWLYKAVSVFYYRFLHGFAKMVDDMIAHNALHFMDEPNFKEAIKHLPMRTKTVDHYLPVPASDYNGKLKKEKSKDCINVCWLGRLSDEKTPILKLTIQTLSAYAQKHHQKIQMHILGYGERQNEIDGMELDNDFYHQLKSRPIPSKDIDSYLLNNIDLMFAMGTSALESAKLGVPTVLVDLSYEEVRPDYVFKKISERNGFELAHQIGKNDYKVGNTSFDKIMDNVNNHFEEFARESREYFVRNHSLSTVGEQFVSLLKEADYTFQMIDTKLTRPVWIWRIWSKIKNK